MKFSKSIIIPVLFCNLLIIAIVGYSIATNPIIELVFAHLIGVGILGLYGSWSGAVAFNNGKSYAKAFLITFFIPIMVGFLAAYYVIPSDSGLPCGGAVSLSVGIFFPILFSM